MALTRPSLPQKVIMDVVFASSDVQNRKRISFVCYNSEEWDGFNVRILDNYGVVIHTASIGKKTASFEIGKDSGNDIHTKINNGNSYKIEVQTYVGSGENQKTSEYSSQCNLLCYTQPVCSVTNPALENGQRIVPTQNYIFTGEYSQSENVEIKTSRFVLYDKNKNLIQAYDEQYYDAPSVNMEFQQKVEGFTPQTEYYIEVQCTDQNDLLVSSGLIYFYVDYERPRITQVVDLENEKETASVKISSSMIQILFKVDDEPPFYINEQEIALREILDAEGNVVEGTKHTRAYLDERIDITGNFTMKLYARMIPTTDIGEEKYFLTLTSIDGNVLIQMKESEGRIHVYKTLKPKPSGATLVGHYASPVIEGYVPNDPNNYLVIQINHVNRKIDVFAQVVGSVA
jgi:hypothetical protein